MNILQICPPHLSAVATLTWDIQKSHFSTLLIIYFRLCTLPQMKINSNCCTAALAVYLLLFSASYYLHSPSSASGARYRRSACMLWARWGLRQRLVATWAEFQHSVVCCATDQYRKRLEACINAEGGHSEYLLWRCLSDDHNRFFSDGVGKYDAVSFLLR